MALYGIDVSARPLAVVLIVGDGSIVQWEFEDRCCPCLGAGPIQPARVVHRLASACGRPSADGHHEPLYRVPGAASMVEEPFCHHRKRGNHAARGARRSPISALPWRGGTASGRNAPRCLQADRARVEVVEAPSVASHGAGRRCGKRTYDPQQTPSPGVRDVCAPGGGIHRPRPGASRVVHTLNKPLRPSLFGQACPQAL